MGMQGVLVELPSALGANEGGDHLAPCLVGQADDGDLGDACVLQQDILDLGGEVILAAANDHLLHPAGDRHVTARIHEPEVARVQPALRIDGLGRRRGVVVIAQHDAGATGTDFADLADIGSPVVAEAPDRNLGLRDRLAHRVADVVDAVVAVVLGDDRAVLGLPVKRREGAPEGPLDAPHKLGRHHRAAAAHQLQAGDVAEIRFVGIEHGEDHRRHTEGDGGLLAFDQVDDDVGIEQAHENHSAAGLQRAQRQHAASAGVEHRHGIDPGGSLGHAAAARVVARVVDEPAMAQHRALGEACRARGVLNLCRIARRHVGRPPAPPPNRPRHGAPPHRSCRRPRG